MTARNFKKKVVNVVSMKVILKKMLLSLTSDVIKLSLIKLNQHATDGWTADENHWLK